jgi:hypothetical protein
MNCVILLRVRTLLSGYPSESFHSFGATPAVSLDGYHSNKSNNKKTDDILNYSFASHPVQLDGEKQQVFLFSKTPRPALGTPPPSSFVFHEYQSSLPEGKAGGGVILTTHLQLAPRLRMCVELYFCSPVRFCDAVR